MRIEVHATLSWDGKIIPKPSAWRTYRLLLHPPKLIIPGGTLLSRFLLKRNLVQQIHLTLEPQIIGSSKAKTLTSHNPKAQFLKESAHFKLIDSHSAVSSPTIYHLVYEKLPAQ